MIVCPNCNHQNPEAAVHCEACYTPLPAMTICPGCGASVQADASFCGQCGFNLQGTAESTAVSQGPDSSAPPLPATVSPSPHFDIPDLSPLEPLVEPQPLAVSAPPAAASGDNSSSSQSPEFPAAAAAAEASSSLPNTAMTSSEIPASASSPASSSHKTQLQTQVARLLHVQTNTTVELPGNLAVIHIGKPNDRVPPDVDTSGYPNSEIVSRIHADIRVEGDIYYIEDVGSSNGTYINNAPLPAGNRHRLRSGDRIALGKGDKVTFLFQIS